MFLISLFKSFCQFIYCFICHKEWNSRHFSRNEFCCCQSCASRHTRTHPYANAIEEERNESIIVSRNGSSLKLTMFLRINKNEAEWSEHKRNKFSSVLSRKSMCVPWSFELMRRSRALAKCEVMFDLKFPTSAYVRQLSCCVTHIYMRSRSSHAYLGTFDVPVATATLIFLILSSFHIHFSRPEEWSKWSLHCV